jgi:hypothetical protein
MFMGFALALNFQFILQTSILKILASIIVTQGLSFLFTWLATKHLENQKSITKF